MKKILLLTISILMVTAVFARKGRAENPIPSYKVPVFNKSYFQEDSSKPSTYSPSDEKRDMNVSNEGSAGGNRPGSTSVIVYVYRLDGAIVLGPFEIPAGETRAIQIDGYRWGVIAQSNYPTLMSVWTSDQP
jgi:hypothetical protein